MKRLLSIWLFLFLSAAGHGQSSTSKLVPHPLIVNTVSSQITSTSFDRNFSVLYDECEMLDYYDAIIDRVDSEDSYLDSIDYYIENRLEQVVTVDN